MKNKKSEQNTRDFFDFDHNDLKLAAKLLTVYRSSLDRTQLLGYPVTVEKNPESKEIFLVDSDFNTALIRGDRLEDYLVCGCLNEGFREHMFASGSCCREVAKRQSFNKIA